MKVDESYAHQQDEEHTSAKVRVEGIPIDDSLWIQEANQTLNLALAFKLR